MLELIRAGGWLMLPILVCSVLAMAITLERFWALRTRRVLPPQLLRALRIASEGTSRLTIDGLLRFSQRSPLGRILRAGLLNQELGREAVKESLQDSGRQVVHELERYLNALGTIAAITPLLGLLGTVIGMIEVFNVIAERGSGDTELLAAGISKALITTAGGLTVAIPSLLFYRYFRARVDALVLRMEDEALLVVELVGRLGPPPPPRRAATPPPAVQPARGQPPPARPPAQPKSRPDAVRPSEGPL
ncbi:MAG: MotA/TolQ/ExbB proton channel family protein [Candidatus Competibacterales bacterium]|nr:MotA/TolQ/ExbB proton channel family protein [Candidatus Competibacterales bacterium]